MHIVQSCTYIQLFTLTIYPSLYIKKRNKDLSRNILNIEEDLFNNSRQSDY